jgi:DNA-binding CsgD family transcriptional regulator
VTDSALRVAVPITRRPIVASALRTVCASGSLTCLDSFTRLEAYRAAHGDDPTHLVVLDVDSAPTAHWGPSPFVATLMILLPLEPDASSWAAMSLGVKGVIMLRDPVVVLSEAVSELRNGGFFASPRAVQALLTDFAALAGRPRIVDPHPRLTSREREILELMVEGLSTKNIAYHLGLAVKTVEAHRQRIFVRLDVASQAEAVARALHAPDILAR